MLFRRLTDTICGLCSLARLGLQTRFRTSGSYWRWRNETAFGGEGNVSSARKRHAVRDYAKWMWRMGRYR
ncbi:MAG: hypothetical protein ACR2GY_08510 [Phycisphaerales bacterium]